MNVQKGPPLARADSLLELADRRLLQPPSTAQVRLAFLVGASDSSGNRMPMMPGLSKRAARHETFAPRPLRVPRPSLQLRVPMRGRCLCQSSTWGFLTFGGPKACFGLHFLGEGQHCDMHPGKPLPPATWRLYAPDAIKDDLPTRQARTFCTERLSGSRQRPLAGIRSQSGGACLFNIRHGPCRSLDSNKVSRLDKSLTRAAAIWL